MTKSEIIRFVVLRSIGNFLVLFALFGVVATFGPTIYYELQFRIIQAKGITFKVVEDEALFGDVLARTKHISVEKKTETPSLISTIFSSEKEHIIVPKDTDFSVIIPKIGATAQIIPNVNPENEKEYLEALSRGVAHAKGSVFPGMKGNVYLFAHSTDSFWNVGRYNAVFYLIKDLDFGDPLMVFFENKRYNYVVTDSKIVDPEDVDLLVKSQTGTEEHLILQTCWPPGTTWKRLIVLAKAK